MNIKNLIERAGYNTRSYSGRGMYGKECLGVDIEANNREHIVFLVVDVLLEATQNLDNSDVQDLGEQLKFVKQDSMGQGSIIYFPEIPYIDEDSDED